MGFFDRWLKPSRRDAMPPPPAGPAFDNRPSAAPAQPPPSFSAPTVPSTWLQWPTLSWCLGYDHLQEVAGESYRQDALEYVAQGRTEDGCVVGRVTAQLVPEPNNQHDRNAIRVEVGGHLVGYIPRAETGKYHAAIHRLAVEARPTTTRARLTGGWDRGAGDRGHIGIRLEVDPALQPTSRATWFLPRGSILTATATGSAATQAMLAAMLGSATERVVLMTLGWPPEDGRIAVRSGDDHVGYLRKDLTERFGALLDDVCAAELPPTCRAVLERDAKGVIKVRVDVASE